MVLDYERFDLRNVDHLMVEQIWILSTESLPTAAIHFSKIRDDNGALLHWKEVASGARMPALGAAPAARDLAFLFGRGLETAAITGGWLG